MADVYISASVTETQGLTYIEAMASELPVVVKKDKSTEGMIQDNVTGKIFEQDDDLADAVNEIYTNKRRTQQNVQNANMITKEYSLDNFTNNVLEVYNWVVKEQFNKSEECSHASHS